MLRTPIQYAMSYKLGGKWRTECLGTRFLLPSLCFLKLKTTFKNLLLKSFVMNKEVIRPLLTDLSLLLTYYTHLLPILLYI